MWRLGPGDVAIATPRAGSPADGRLREVIVSTSTLCRLLVFDMSSVLRSCALALEISIQESLAQTLDKVSKIS